MFIKTEKGLVNIDQIKMMRFPYDEDEHQGMLLVLKNDRVVMTEILYPDLVEKMEKLGVLI
ncbi:hypothetical protein [Streptococcus danieliae]|uniref:Uncharacterized protein n=1 Tax=Streptococcus danieliae TaxID=747656 RepID=A0A7X3KB23_9STRE|nr:hypothetical protein [Streptococcus danieliae]MBF0699161.1 hypothetical protein [Streptococcus danieliae]MVX58151.1 hypothetical protein [Streptococcus danieliae]NYS96337.1 hypothetical protein [Streptococcus danieliae]